MLRWRIPLGIVLVATLVALMWLDHTAPVRGVWLFGLVVVLTPLATGEFLSMARGAGLRPISWPIYIGNLAIMAGLWLGWCAELYLPAKEAAAHAIPSATSWPLAAMGVALLLVFVGEMRRYEKPGGVTANLTGSVFALVYVGLLLAILLDLRMRFGVGAIATVVIVVRMGDTGAYTFGRLFGRHQLAPILSPKKTIEGAIGSVACSILGAWLGLNVLCPAMGGEASSPIGWILFGLLVGIAGMIGDLAESLVKRDAGQKNSSAWLPGYGGVMDLMDSTLLAGPIAWLCFALAMVGK